MNKGEYGSGSLIERTPGHWQVTVPLGRGGVAGRRGRRRFTVRGTRRDAQRALRDALHQRDSGFAAAPDKLSVGDWLRRWLASRSAEGHVGARTQERYRGVIEKHLIPALGQMRLQAVRPDHISDLKARWLSGSAPTARTALSGGTVHKHLVVLRRSFADAVKLGLIVRNPVDAVTAPSVKVRRERRALTATEITELLAAATGTRFDIPIRITLSTGLREGELLGLKWDDVDLDARSFEVRHTAVYVNGKVILGMPKTERSRRTIELSEATVQLLRRHRAAQLEHRLAIGPLWREHGMVFPSLVGTPWLARTFLRDFKMVVAKTGISDSSTLNWHALRHTAATQWICHGVDIFSVSRRLGHASAAFTMDVYGHLLKGQQRHAAEALDHLISQS